MVELFANSGDPDLGLHCLPITLLEVARLQGVISAASISLTVLGDGLQS